MTAGSGGHSPVRELEAVFDLEDLLATIHPCFQVDVMRAMQLTCCLVFDISITRDGVMCAAHVTLGFGDFGLWNGHFLALSFFESSDTNHVHLSRQF